VTPAAPLRALITNEMDALNGAIRALSNEECRRVLNFLVGSQTTAVDVAISWVRDGVRK
jgi:hypothetical protein